ncbi:MAG TPA: carboxypeptidase-like regulatory domain-containing protein [Longimicrobiales bacterium]|nr:carboxypeptidase-like regulatory domain-containing protein [Longimicrobiales bacterium]
MRRTVLRGVGPVLALLATTVGALRAQTLSGVVLEAGTDRPISFAEITILGDTGAVAASTFSDGEGAFSARLPRAGGYQIYAVRLGYYASVSEFIDVVKGEDIAVAVRLQPKPFETDSLTVEVSPPVSPLERVGFYDRMKAGVGSFFTREDIEAKTVAQHTLADVIREAPGVRIDTDRYGKNRVAMATLQGVCAPYLIVDGLTLQPPWEDVVNVGDLEGVEVYPRVSQVPSEYLLAARTSGCGVVVAWTRIGLGRR